MSSGEVLPTCVRPTIRWAMSLILPILATASLAAMSPARGDIVLTFGVYSADKPSAVVVQMRPILDILEQLMSDRIDEPVTIKMHVAATYEKGLEDLLSGRVDFARFGPAPYVLVKREDPGISILAMEAKRGEKRFNGVICVRRDSDIKIISDLKGRSFAFGDRNSTIGRYLSQLLLLRHGVTASDLSDYQYLGRHDKVGAAVGAELYDAGALKESTFKKLVKNGTPIRVIATMPNVTKPWISRSHLSPRIAEALRFSLLQLTDKQALKFLGKDGFVEGDDSDYQMIRDAIMENPKFLSGGSLTSAY